VDWQLVAEQIVDDLVSNRAFESNELCVLEAKAHLRASLSSFSDSL
jgi:hypothetical protein